MGGGAALTETALPLVSVVVPTRAPGPLLSACVESLLAQDYPGEVEIVVVANGGPRPSLPPGVRCLALERPDANSARNLGVQSAAGDPVCLVDDDVVAPPGWLEALVRGALRHPAAECVGGPVRPRFEGRPPRTCARHGLPGAALEEGEQEREVGLVWGGNMALRQAAFERVGPFREGMPLLQEWEWEQRLRLAGGRIVYIPAAWLWHRRGPADLHLPALVREFASRGWTRVVEDRRLGMPVRYRRRLAAGVVSHLAHALTRRCSRGLLEAARHAGMLAASLR